MYLGTASRALGGATMTVPVLRAPTFPSWEPLDPKMTGLLGLSSLGRSKSTTVPESP